jgi:RNA polymerase sigma-70 factor (ECF subfamily)
MVRTSASLLDRLKQAKPDSPDWQRLQSIYRPLICTWLSRLTNPREELDDLVQEVFQVLVREVSAFQPGRTGAFRAWLRQITVNRARAFWKARRRRPHAGLGGDADPLFAQLEDPHSDLSREWDREHDRHVLRRLLGLVQPDFEAQTWQAFTRFALEGRPASQVAGEMGLSVNAVVLAKYRILKRLREEAREFVD